MKGLNPGAAPHALDAEIRHATVLKCDIVGSTRLKRGLDLDGQLAFKRGLEATISDVAAHHAGRVEQFEGDGALVFFGYPEAREDAAESAVRMGLEVVEAIAAARFVPGVRLQIRVGIASGLLAVVKEPRVERGEPYVGLIIDMAERLRAAASPDQVVACDGTKRQAARFFEYEDLGTVTVKGFEDGLRAWHVLRRSTVVSRFEAQRYDESSGQLVGRREVLAFLSEAWSAARRGHGRVVGLVGEAGIGKSRLARATLDLAAPDGATVLSIDCMPSTGNTPLFPIGMLLRRIANIPGGTPENDKHALATGLLSRCLAPSEVSVGLSYLAPLFGLDVAPSSVDHSPDQVRDQTIAAVVKVLRALAACGPTVLLCEDLHWADDTTLSIVARLADGIAELSVLMIVTARPESERLPDVIRAASIVLSPLDSATSGQLVRSVAAGAPLSDDALRRIVERCEGVPLLLEEVTRSTVETAHETELVTVDAKVTGAIPTPLQLIVESRLGRSPDLGPIAQAASVLGREFSVSVLEEMVPEEQKTRVREALTLFGRHGLFARTANAGDHARFRHAMICEAVHDTLLRRDRQRLHSHAADILRGGYLGTLDAAPDVLAEHLRMAERWLECVQTHLEASRDTAARGAYVETEGHCQAALKLIGSVEHPEQRRELEFQLEVQLGVAGTGRYGYASRQAEEAYRRAEAVCGEGAEAYPIIRGLATVNLVRGNLATAHSLSLQGIALAERSNRPEFLIDAMSVQCYTTLYYGRLADCRTWIDRCLALYRQAKGESLTYPVPQDAATAAYALLPTVEWLMGKAHAAEDAVAKGLAHVDHLNRDFDRALLYAWLAGTRYTQRRYEDAERHAAAATAISQERGYLDWYATGQLMGLLARAARRAEPLCVQEARDLYANFFERQGVGLNASYYLWGLARGYARLGDRHTAHAMLAEAAQKSRASGESRMDAELLILQAELEPDDAAARPLLARARHIADGEGAVATALRAAVALALRSPASEANVEMARTTLQVLEGGPLPAQRDWMHARLERLRGDLELTPGTASAR